MLIFSSKMNIHRFFIDEIGFCVSSGKKQEFLWLKVWLLLNPQIFTSKHLLSRNDKIWKIEFHINSSPVNRNDFWACITRPKEILITKRPQSGICPGKHPDLPFKNAQ